MNFMVALCQMKVSVDKKTNLTKAENMIREAVSNGAQVIALPEMFNCPYSISFSA